MKLTCLKCTKMAVWYYMPGSDEIAYCDLHIPRGCSCNVDYETDEPILDDQDRLLPCVEYDYNELGFDDE